jgi:hypothetical protein
MQKTKKQLFCSSENEFFLPMEKNGSKITAFLQDNKWP